jgi:hypothetical protein
MVGASMQKLEDVDEVADVKVEGRTEPIDEKLAPKTPLGHSEFHYLRGTLQ